MRYLCLVHFDVNILLAMTPEERQDLDRRSLAYDDELRRRGAFLRSDALEGPEAAVLVRRRDGQILASDGPYLETKEQMGGFILIEARDLNEAVDLAAGIPIAAFGTIEVRPVYLIPTPP